MGILERINPWNKPRDPFKLSRKEKKELKEAVDTILRYAKERGWQIEQKTDDGEDEYHN